MSKPLVKTQYCELELPSGGMPLSAGETLSEITIAYETYGELSPRKDNVICVCHALTGDAHAAWYHSEDDSEPGWWDPLIGPGKALDTDRYFVICTNILGGCKGTTGPSSRNPATGVPYGIDFPLITIADTVAVEKRFFDQLGISELNCVIGGSMGGMRALEWAVKFPDYVKRCICIASAVNLSPQALAFDVIGRQEIESDPDWRSGNFYDQPRQPVSGLSRARQIGHVTYLSSASMIEKFGRDERESPYPGQTSKFSTNFQVESYLAYQGTKFTKRFDANSYLYISRMMDMFDLTAEFGSVAAAFAKAKSRFLIMSISTDWLFPSEQQLEIVQALLQQRKPTSYFSLDTPFGHDAFLIEYERVSAAVDAFLNGSHPSEPPEHQHRLDLACISRMLNDGSHVLDVGSGDGSLMLALQQRKGITGICLDVDFDKVVACMRKGLDALQLDADVGLELIPRDAFDSVLLNQTIQQLHSALRAIKQMLRIAADGVVGFPNFAYYLHRLKLAFCGQLPVSESLPYEWYETPNIHVVTVRDFRELCRRHDLKIADIEFIADDWLGQTLIGLGVPNLGAERGLVKIARSGESRSA